ncbi:MAG: hypothetical protein K2K98_09270 [Muribaculaceae bacterium]|nr:hypothetical protein [Muribaculaceae bacterium]
MLYYKIPPTYVAMFGLANTMTRFPDGNYFVPRAVMARINPDIDKALEMSGGIALTLDEARDEQIGIAFHPLPGDSADKEADTDEAMPQEGAPE